MYLIIIYIWMQIFIQGRSNLNRAVDGDIVAVELLAEDQWSSPSDIILEDEEEAGVDDVLETEKVLDKFVSSNKMQKTPTGKVVGIIRRNWRQYCGILQPSNIEGVSIRKIVDSRSIYSICNIYVS